MKRTPPLLWALVVAGVGVYLALRLIAGVSFQTDLLALLPQEERDQTVQAAKDRVAAAFGRRIFLIIGDADRARARQAATALARRLEESGLAETVFYRIDVDAQRRLAQAFFPFRDGLLAAADRERLQQSRGQEVVKRALASVYGLVGVADAALLRNDPFLLLPSFFTALPLPLARLAPDDGLLSVEEGGRTYLFLTALLRGEAYSLAFQDRFIAWLDGAEGELRAAAPGLEILRTGALFFAHAGAQQALGESSMLGIASLAGTALLVLFAFRALRPLWLSAVAIAVGVLFAYAAALALFGQLHVGALLFGVSLIGVAVDYSLIFCAQRFDAEPATPAERLRRVLPAISLALATTVIGYLTLLLAPFPGLHQVAAFSVVGLTASFLTVVFWAPFFDERAPLRHGGWLLAGAEGLWRFWHEPRCVRVRWSLAGGLGLTTVLGLAHLAIDDDVRRLQPLSPALKQQELAIQRLTGVRPGGQFLLVQAATTEAALQIEEALLPRLEVARRGGALASYQALAQFIPSAQRQRENRALVRDRLVRPFLAAYYDQLGMAGGAGAVNGESRVLEPADLAAEPALWFLGNLVVPMESAGATHLVLLTGVERPAELRQLGAELPGVRFIDPTGDVTRLLGEYRLRAVALLGLSVLFMLPVLAWRYGVAGSLRVAFPSLAAVLLAPAATSLLGVTFTFFNAMALVMVLSIGIDYAIFCREAAASRRAVTLLGVGLAMLTALLSFGLLALSRTVAVEAFGLTMLFGISIAFALAPLAAASAEPVQDQPGRIA